MVIERVCRHQIAEGVAWEGLATRDEGQQAQNVLEATTWHPAFLPSWTWENAAPGRLQVQAPTTGLKMPDKLTDAALVCAKYLALYLALGIRFLVWTD